MLSLNLIREKYGGGGCRGKPKLKKKKRRCLFSIPSVTFDNKVLKNKYFYEKMIISSQKKKKKKNERGGVLRSLGSVEKTTWFPNNRQRKLVR